MFPDAALGGTRARSRESRTGGQGDDMKADAGLMPRSIFSRLLWLTLPGVAAVFSLVQPSPASASQLRGSSWCAGAQSWKTVRSSLGMPIRVKATVLGVTYAPWASGQPTFIDLGHRYPSRDRVSVVIWSVDRVNFPRAPERMFRPRQL